MGVFTKSRVIKSPSASIKIRVVLISFDAFNFADNRGFFFYLSKQYVDNIQARWAFSKSFPDKPDKISYVPFGNFKAIAPI